MLEKLKSRKLWAAVGTAVAIMLVEIFEVPIDLEAIYAIAGVSSVYIAGQSLVDHRKADPGVLE